MEKEIAAEIENYEPTQLNSLLERFYAEIKNKHGEDYEPESLKVMITSLDRRLRAKAINCPLFATENSVPPNKYWTEKRNSFAQLAAASAQKTIGRGRRNSLEEREIGW